MSHLFLSAFISPRPPHFSARAAARLAATCRGFRAAHAESWWPALDPATGSLLEPRSGRFWRELSPGDDVQAAVNACPEGGCILLRPGVHTLVPQEEGVGLEIRRAVSIFGRGAATVQSLGSTYTIIMGALSATSPFALDGLVVRSVDQQAEAAGVVINSGSARLQSCAITGPSFIGLLIGGASPSPPVITSCRWGGRGYGRDRRRCFYLPFGLIDAFDAFAEYFVLTHCRIDGSTISGFAITQYARPRLMGNEIWGNGCVGIIVDAGGDPFLSGNTIRDHAGVSGRGVFVDSTSHGLATILPDNVFLRNGGGDVVRRPAPAPAPV